VSEQQPADDADDRPWERPGEVRRDCEPHRGAFLQTLGALSAVPGTLAVGCFFALPVSMPAAMLALGLGGTAWFLARRDLREMQGGHRDPGGRRATVKGSAFGAVGVLLGCLSLLGALALLVVSLLGRALVE
jgi:hypothetical protein